MPLLRLKSYTSEIFSKYLALHEEPTESEEFSTEGSRITSSYIMVCQTVLFFNQSLPDMPLTNWCGEVPASYLLKLDHTISLLEDSRKWAISSLGMPQQNEPDDLRDRIITDIDDFRIRLQPELADDAVTGQFTKCCNLIHDILPLNRRTRNALIRLIWAYLSAKDCIAMAKEMSLADRIEYLRRLTKYQ